MQITINQTEIHATLAYKVSSLEDQQSRTSVAEGVALNRLYDQQFIFMDK